MILEKLFLHHVHYMDMLITNHSYHIVRAPRDRAYHQIIFINLTDEACTSLHYYKNRQV